MFQQWWNYDYLVFIIFITTSIFLLNFMYERESLLKYYMGSGGALGLSRTYYNDILSINYKFQSTLNYLFSYLFIIVLLIAEYWYGWGDPYIYGQVYNAAGSWFYMFYIILINLFLFYSFNDVFRDYLNLFDIRGAVVVLALLFNFYIFLNNYFIVLFLIECQGIVVIYLLGAATNYTEVSPKSVTLRTSGERSQVYQLNALFLNFWAAFVSAVLFVLVGVRLSYLYGSLGWTDLNYISYFSFYYEGLSTYNILGLGLILYIAIFIKIGVFPFHFWKPDLYKTVPLWIMLWYMSVYTFAFMFFIVSMLNFFYSYLACQWHHIIYILQITGFLVLLNVLYSIVEIRPFLAYMSVFHMLFIVLLLLLPGFIGGGLAINYLFLYVVLTCYTFFILFYVGNNIQYLTDFQKLEQNLIVLSLFIMGFAAVSGLPPFIGFWMKFSVVVGLLINNEFLLALLALAGGLFLMYFYFQNYRFSGSLKFSWGGNYLKINNKGHYISSIINTLLCVNFSYIFFMNDVLNWNSFVGFIFY